MATSSLFHNFVIEGEENVRRFIDAFDESMDEEQPRGSSSIREIKDPKELKEVFARQSRYLETRRKRMEAIQNAV